MKKPIIAQKNLKIFILILIILVFHNGSLQNSYAQKEEPNEKQTGNSCIDCHKKLSGKLKSVVLEWKTSVHSKKHTNCNICHGGNPNEYNPKLSKSTQYNFIGKPAKTEITDFCGRIECHSISLFQFKKSPHYKSAIEKGEPNCATCHGNHEIQKTTSNIMNEKKCSSCHSVEFSIEIVDKIFEFNEHFTDIENDLDYLNEENADVWETSSKLDETKRLLYQLVHAFSREEMEYSQRIIDLEISTMKQDLKEKIAKVQRLGLLYNLTIINIALIIVGFSIYLLVLFIKRKIKTKSELLETT